MQILTGFKFFENENQYKESNILKNIHGSLLTLQVTGEASDVNIVAYGKIDNENEDFVELPIIKNIDYKVVSAIPENGIYHIGVDGISQVYLELKETDGNVTVYGKVGA